MRACAHRLTESTRAHVFFPAACYCTLPFCSRVRGSFCGPATNKVRPELVHPTSTRSKPGHGKATRRLLPIQNDSNTADNVRLNTRRISPSIIKSTWFVPLDLVPSQAGSLQFDALHMCFSFKAKPVGMISGQDMVASCLPSMHPAGELHLLQCY